MKSLSFGTLRNANVIRLPLFKNNKGEIAHSENDGSDWSDSDWFEAIVGELGEYANLKKKVRRGDISFDDAKQELAFELADVVIYLDILSHRLGIDLGDAIKDKFNLKSEQSEINVLIDDNDEVDFANYVHCCCGRKYNLIKRSCCPECSLPYMPF